MAPHTTPRSLRIYLAGQEPTGAQLFAAAAPSAQSKTRFCSTPLEHAERPDLILLDLKQGSEDGLASIRRLRQTRDWVSIPLIALVPPGDHALTDAAYGLGATCCVPTPRNRTDAEKLVRELEHYWLEVVKLPTRTGV